MSKDVEFCNFLLIYTEKATPEDLTHNHFFCKNISPKVELMSSSHYNKLRLFFCKFISRFVNFLLLIRRDNHQQQLR